MNWLNVVECYIALGWKVWPGTNSLAFGPIRKLWRKLSVVSRVSEPNFIKRFQFKFTDIRNKLECLALAGLSSLVWIFQVREEPTRVKHISVAPHKGCLLDLPIIIRQD